MVMAMTMVMAVMIHASTFDETGAAVEAFEKNHFRCRCLSFDLHFTMRIIPNIATEDVQR